MLPSPTNISMNTPIIKPIVLACLGIAIGTLLPGCVEPYAQGYGSPYGATAYRPGYEVRTLPPGYRTEVIDGTRYYHYNGNYYRPRSSVYVVVEPPRSRYESTRPRYNEPYSRSNRPDERREVTIEQLPRGYREVNTPHGRYYQYNGVYYQQRRSGYVIVNRPY